MVAHYFTFWVVLPITVICGLVSLKLCWPDIIRIGKKVNATISANLPFIGWIISTLFAVVLVALFAVNPAVNWIQERRELAQIRNDSIRTRPICGPTCTNFDWIVDVCKRDAVKIGGLGALGANPQRATRHFRGCLIDKGMNWEKCKKGEPLCMRFQYMGMRRRGTGLPSFVE